MSAPPTSASELPSLRVAPKMALWYRLVAVVLGLAGLGSGGVAVFVTHVEAGPVALITAGFLLLVIGASGQLPNRLKIGDNEAEWYSLLRLAQETAETTAEATASKTVRSELEIAMKRIEKTSPELVASWSTLAFAIYGRNILKEAASKLDNVQVLSHKIGLSNFEVWHGANGIKAYCEVAPAKSPLYDVAQRKSQLLSSLSELGVDRLLLLTNTEFPRAVRAAIANDPLIETVIISQDDDDGDVLRVMEAITSLLELPRI